MSQLNGFNYQIHGQDANPKVVFLHGLMGFASNWRGVARHFESRFQVLLYDQRGHGKSPQPTTGYSIAEYAQDFVTILDGLGWEKASLVGHSMGGRVAIEVASRFPQRIEKLVVVDIGPVSDIRSMTAIEEKINSVPVPFASRDEARTFFDTEFLQKYKNETLKQFFYANIEQKANGEFTWKFSRPGILETLWKARTLNQWPQVEALTVPTLWIRGEKSADLPQDLFEEILRRNLHILGVEVPGAGHWVHADKPQETIEALADFL
ncbi:MAG: alpha/beta hydrolase [Bdellovibrionaceae bacterium]|nr:alpha/beta hydrolase [Pseudobdellovibrionaceae bacterium]